MNKARPSVAVSVALVMAATYSTVLGAGPALASRAATTHTLKFTAHTLQSHDFTNSGIQVERDTQNGKTVGFGLLNCVFSQSGNPSCSIQYAMKDGTLFVHATLQPQGASSGKVTGGTRQFRGATGSMTASPGPNNTTRIVINYQT